MTYVPATYFARTDAEMRDPLKAWARTDLQFFAAGACHILAWAFMRANPDAGFAIRYLSPAGGSDCHHVYVSNGLWAFDFWGWTIEKELNVAYRGEPETIAHSIEEFCVANNHRLPEQFPFTPWPRAQSYLERHGARWNTGQ